MQRCLAPIWANAAGVSSCGALEQHRGTACLNFYLFNIVSCQVDYGKFPHCTSSLNSPGVTHDEFADVGPDPWDSKSGGSWNLKISIYFLPLHFKLCASLKCLKIYYALCWNDTVRALCSLIPLLHYFTVNSDNSSQTLTSNSTSAFVVSSEAFTTMFQTNQTTQTTPFTPFVRVTTADFRPEMEIGNSCY